MRISTSAFYDIGISSMQQQSAQLLRVQQQIASGRRILTPADDPVGAARVLEVSQFQSVNTQFGVNTGSAGDSLSMEESVLGSVGSLLQNVRDRLVYAGDATLTAGDRAGMAGELRGMYQQLLGLANSTDGGGQYLFSGFQGGTRPFSQSSPGVVAYAGDQGQRLVQVSASRQFAVSDAGADVFQRIRTGNGEFTTQAGNNSGTGLIDAGTVINPIKWNGVGNNQDFTIQFSVSGGVTTYDIVDNVAGTSLLTGLAPGAAPYPRAYSSGSNINFSQVGPPAFDYGAQLSIAGAPADGDSFSVKASAHQDVFKTIDDLVTLLQNSGTSGTALTNRLAELLGNVDSAIDNVSSVRTATGARLRELDSIKTAGDDRDLQYDQTLSRLQDLDYAKATSELMQQQVNLEAAQKSFAKVAGLSLFEYL